MAVEKYLLGSQTGNVPMIGVNVLAYGADPTGVSDSTSAFNNAIAALPAGGGTVWVPIGTYKCNTRINIGNGTSSAVSTTSGITLSGVCPPGMPADIMTGAGPVSPCKITAGGTDDIIVVNGPLSGWSVRNLVLDGNAGAAIGGINVLSGSGGIIENLIIRNCSIGSIIVNERQATGGLASVVCYSNNNFFRNIHIIIPDVDGTSGVWLTGNFVDASSGSSYNMFENFNIQLPTTTGSHTVYGLRLEACNNETFRHIRFLNSHSGTGTENVVLFNYSTTQTSNPSDVRIEDVDFGSSSAVIANNGSPGASAQPNRIVSISASLGRPSNPSLTNLDWGYSNSSP